MNPDEFAIAVTVAVFAAGALGLILRHILPEKHVTGAAKDMIGAVVGLLTLLSALVLGLLIWTAHGVYSAQNAAIQTLAAKALDLDLALAEYGPEANAMRAQFRQGLASTIDQVWGASESDRNFAAANFAAAVRSRHNWEASLASLRPSTDAQKQALAAAKSLIESIAQSRLQMSFALTNPVSIPLVLVVAGWATLLFFGYGLMSGSSTASFLATGLGAIAAGSAVLLILELSSPYSGIFRASPAPLEQVLAVMGKD
ncbi:MAG TPA: hypothetical protein VGH40_13415 [Roseiarcus sp.]|jgi:hypothetical protein